MSRLVGLLTTPFVPDDYVRLINPLWTRETLHARVISVQAETAGCASITLQPGLRWQRHRAGQYLRLGVSIDGVRHTRCYSISSAPERDDGLITITVKAVADGRVSQYLSGQLQAGAVVDISPAEGDFTMPYAINEPVLLIAAGSGITPMMSLLRSAAARNAMPETSLLYYSPTPADTIFREELQQLATQYPALTVHFVHTRAGCDGPLRGHFSAAHLTAACVDWKQRRSWACGPAALLDTLEAQWSVQGLGSRLNVERFRLSPRMTTAEAQGGMLHFTASKKQIKHSGDSSILDTAEQAGLAPAHGCRMGICHGCMARLICGAVRDLRDGRLHSDENDLIQICVCAPVGAVQIEL